MNCIAGGTQALHTVPQLVCGNPCRPAHGTGGGSGLSGAGTSAAGGGPCCIYLFHLPPRVSVSAEGQSKLFDLISKEQAQLSTATLLHNMKAHHVLQIPCAAWHPQGNNPLGREDATMV